MGISGLKPAFSLILFCIATSGASNLLADDSFETWLLKQENISWSDLIQNITFPGTAPGVVIASPSKSDPNYFFDWTRDGALVMQLLVYRYIHIPTQFFDEKESLRIKINQYAQAARTKQLQSTASGDATTTGSGEPKWHVDLTPFWGPWGRPQNDGPALRASTLIQFALQLYKEGDLNNVRLLYDSKIPTESVIKADLEFVSHHWRRPNFEMWEEVDGDHFSTRLQMRRALLLGTELARKMNDSGAADWYQLQADLILKELEKHWRPDIQLMQQTINQVGGLPNKYSQLDFAMMIALIDHANDPKVKISDDRYLKTFEELRQVMHRLYKINSTTHDRSGDLMADALGRYPEDSYNGYETGKTGNPWFILTATAADYSYKLALEWKMLSKIEITSLNKSFFHGWLNLKSLTLKEGESITPQDPRFQLILKACLETGDRFLKRWRFHSAKDGSTAEQMNRDHGYNQGASKLTWNCSSFLTAINTRNTLKENLDTQP